MARKKYGFSFSWKRATGLSSAKGKLSRKTGIPFTRSGRQRKIGRLMTGGGCCVAFASLVAYVVLAIYGFKALASLLSP